MSRFFSVPLCYSLRVHNINPMYRERERKLFVPNLFTSPVPAFIVPISSVPLFPLLCEFQPKPIINIFIGRPFGQCNVPGNIKSQTAIRQNYVGDRPYKIDFFLFPSIKLPRIIPQQPPHTTTCGYCTFTIDFLFFPALSPPSVINHCSYFNFAHKENLVAVADSNYDRRRCRQETIQFCS